MNFLAKLALISIALTIVAACTKPLNVGSDLFKEEELIFQVDSSTTIKARTVLSDSAILYDTLFSYSRYLFGALDDTYLGSVNSEIYSQYGLNNLNFDFEGLVLDSVILSLPYDSSGFYGDITEELNIEVFRLTESMADIESVIGPRSLEHEMSPIGGMYNITPDYLTTFIDVLADGDDFDTLSTSAPAQLRIPLDNSIGEEIMALDTTQLGDQDEFLNIFPGFLIQGQGISNSMLSFSMNNSYSKIAIYLTDPDENKQTKLELSTALAVKYSNIVQDHTNSEAGMRLNSFDAGDSLLYLQSMMGTEIELVFEGLDKFNDALINRAYIDLYVNTPSEIDKLLFPPNRSLHALFLSEGEKVDVEDYEIATSTSTPSIFDGVLDSEQNGTETLYKYRVNLNSHFQSIVNTEAPEKIILQPLLQLTSPRRTIIHGPQSSNHPMKLTVIYTKNTN